MSSVLQESLDEVYFHSLFGTFLLITWSFRSTDCANVCDVSVHTTPDQN